MFREPERSAGSAGAVQVLNRCSALPWLFRDGFEIVGSGGVADHELRVAAAEPDLHGARGQFQGDLAGGVGEGLEEDEPDGRFEGGGESFAQGPRLRASGLCGGVQLALDCCDVLVQLHDTIVTP